MQRFAELFATDGALLVREILEFVVSVALVAEDQVLASLDHDRLARRVADDTNHVLGQALYVFVVGF